EAQAFDRARRVRRPFLVARWRAEADGGGCCAFGEPCVGREVCGSCLGACAADRDGAEDAGEGWWRWCVGRESGVAEQALEVRHTQLGEVSVPGEESDEEIEVQQ